MKLAIVLPLAAALSIAGATRAAAQELAPKRAKALGKQSMVWHARANKATDKKRRLYCLDQAVQKAKAAWKVYPKELYAWRLIHMLLRRLKEAGVSEGVAVLKQLLAKRPYSHSGYANRVLSAIHGLSQGRDRTVLVHLRNLRRQTAQIKRQKKKIADLKKKLTTTIFGMRTMRLRYDQQGAKLRHVKATYSLIKHRCPKSLWKSTVWQPGDWKNYRKLPKK